MGYKLSLHDPNILHNPATAATAVAGAVTTGAGYADITTEALVTAAGATYTLTITNDQVTVDSIALVTVKNGTNATGAPVVSTITPSAGTLVVTVVNAGTVALSGTLVLKVLLLR